MREPSENVVHVIQGQHRLSEAPRDVLVTVLGSCVATCLFDPVRRIGGMNHFLLPGHDPNSDKNVKYGAHSMEKLINAMLQSGANRYRLEVHVFGGANVVKGLGRIGESNAAFAHEFVLREGFMLRSMDIGGTAGRRLRFHPTTGVCQVNRIDPSHIDVRRNEKLRTRPLVPSSSVEFF